MNQDDLQVTNWEFKMKLAAVGAQITHGDGGAAGTGAVVVEV
jgi:hypothetical protein